MNDLAENLYDIQTEQALIGSLLTDPDVIPQIMGVVNAEDFHDHRHQYIYTAIMAIGCNADSLTVATELERRGTLNDSGGEVYLAQLLSEVPTALHAEQYAKTIAYLALCRRIRQHALPNIAVKVSKLDTDPAELLDMAQRELIKATGTAIAGIKPMNTVLSEFYSQYEAKAAGQSITGIRSSISTLDEKTRGWRPGRLITIAGRPGTGKSALMAQFAAHAAISQRKRVAFFTAEMGETEVINRIIGNFAKLDMSKANGHTEADIARAIDVQHKIAASHLTLAHCAGWSPARIIAECERLKSTKGLDLVFIDYIQILNLATQKNEMRYQAIETAAKQFKTLAGKLDIAVFIGCQLNRDAANKPPELHNMREGGLENDPDTVILLHEFEGEDWKNILTFIIAKNRDGKTGRIDTFFDKRFQRISGLVRETVKL